MPYNTTPLSRPDEITGSSALPLARVKKVIAQDEDIAQCSNSAAFTIAVATEEFIRHLTDEAWKANKATTAGKKKQLNYEHVAKAVQTFPHLEFLSDVVPMKRKMKDVKAMDQAKLNGSGTNGNNQAQVGSATEAGTEAAAAAEESRQRSIADMMLQQEIANGINQSDAPMESMMNGHSGSSNGPIAHSPIVDRTVRDVFLAHPTGGSRINTAHDGDTEMLD